MAENNQQQQPIKDNAEQRVSKKTKILVSSIILVFFVSAFLYINSSDLEHTFRISEFINNPVTIVLLLFAIGVILRLLLINIEKKQYVFIAESIIVAATIGLLVEVPHIHSIFIEKQQPIDITGEWIYTVTNQNGYITHGGIGIIEIKANEIHIYGHRKYIQHGDRDFPNETRLDPIPNDGIFWDTDFVAINGQQLKKVHFVYSILLSDKTENSPGQIYRGYCVLTPKEENDQNGDKIVINELAGTYTHLAPGKLSGQITFVRMNNDKALSLIDQKIKDSNRN